ncbi:hypothetical protein [Roseovarius indicus]|nr:hypothetical protein [Roseovarius indicus]
MTRAEQKTIIVTWGDVPTAAINYADHAWKIESASRRIGAWQSIA